MRTLLIKGCFLAALVIATTLAVFLLPIPYSHYLSAILNKLDMVKEAGQDRVIFVGGSGLFDGLDSEKLEARLHRPVVNLGLYAGFGITALLREIRPFLRPGDVVVIVPEYSVVFDSTDEQVRKWLFALAPVRNLPLLYGTAPDPLRAFAIDLVSLVRSKVQALPKAAQEALRARHCRAFFGRGYVYYRKYFTRSGDSLRTMRAAASPDMIEQRGADFFSDPSYRGQSLEAVNDFCRGALRQGVRTYFLFPAYPKEEYRRQQDDMRRYEARLRKELACRILGAPEDFLYPYDFFTNTVNHLNGEGRRIRTEKVFTLLQKPAALSRQAHE
jgi:hypothetical protein